MRMPTVVTSASALVLATFLLLGGCARSSQMNNAVVSPEDPFLDDEDDQRETVLIEPSVRGQGSIDVSPATLDTALIRVDPQESGGAIIEVLVKGSFPDGCSELHELDQEPTLSGQKVSLTMRRPSEEMCTQVVRPYRFFFTLDRRFDPGTHQLAINEHAFSFAVTGK